MITFDDVVKVYPGGGTAVDHLSLELPTGRTTVFVGPSGCGKTTSLRMINRMIGPTSGRVLIDGQDVAGQDEAVLRRGIGYVIQHAGLFPHRTVLDNVATVPMLLGKTRREARAAALELLDRGGLPAERGSGRPGVARPPVRGRAPRPGPREPRSGGAGGPAPPPPTRRSC